MGLMKYISARYHAHRAIVNEGKMSDTWDPWKFEEYFDLSREHARKATRLNNSNPGGLSLKVQRNMERIANNVFFDE